MNETQTKLRDRANKKSLKREDKKRKIASDAITALKHLGFANTSLRDIATKCDLSLGLLHYYFDNKTELIVFCVRIYKEGFVQNITDILDTARGREESISAVARGLATAITEDAETHKLWYDIRSQAMFDEAFQPVVEEIESALIEVVASTAARLERTPNIPIFYAAMDGVFRYLMQKQCSGAQMSRSDIEKVFKNLLQQM